ncbi:Bud-site selection protein [Xylariaceae sp. FL0594]|nr:Bud-site selection protein [Xylariaceae sp. FL0594]
MPKRKRGGEPSLDESLAKWRKELVRALKLAKGFERQRLSKRLRDADPDKKARLEREILVLKSLDLHQAAHAHLCSSLLKVKGISESPKLPADIKPVVKPELSEEEQSALHNVTSALYNRKQVKDVIEEAVTGTCAALRVPAPDKKGKGKGKGKEQATTVTTKEEKKEKKIEKATDKKKARKHDRDEDVDMDSPADDESDDTDGEEPEYDGPPLLKRKKDNFEQELADGDEDDEDAGSDSSDSPEFEGFSDSEEEEKLFSKYDQFVGGSSDSEEDEDDDDDENNSSDEENGVADSRSRSIRKLAPDDDDISLSSGSTMSDQESGSESESDEEDDDDETLAPPAKKKSKTGSTIKAVNPASFPATTGTSTFLPSLMGGYVSGSESSASDVDVAPAARKNRRGQRARQAIWEKKYGDKAKHHQRKDTRAEGWDPKRGAVEASNNINNTPWKKGVKNPFEKNNVHPDRQRLQQQQEQRAGSSKTMARDRRGTRERSTSVPAAVVATTEKPREKQQKPARDDEGSLHPSWAAAKKAKEGVQKVEFQGKKVVFD